jgi:hypothetical protein
VARRWLPHDRNISHAPSFLENDDHRSGSAGNAYLVGLSERRGCPTPRLYQQVQLRSWFLPDDPNALPFAECITGEQHPAGTANDVVRQPSLCSRQAYSNCPATGLARNSMGWTTGLPCSAKNRMNKRDHWACWNRLEHTAANSK